MKSKPIPVRSVFDECKRGIFTIQEICPCQCHKERRDAHDAKR